VTTWRMSAVEKAARAALLRVLRGLPEGRIVLRDGEGSHELGTGTELQARIDIHAPRVYTALLRDRGKGLARTYADGLWDCDDLVSMVRIASRALVRADPWRARISTATWPLKRAWR